MSCALSLHDHAYYYVLRTEARSRVVDGMNRLIQASGTYQKWRNLSLSSIKKEALDYARTEWPRHYGENTHNGFVYSWEKIYHRFSHRPSFFDLAIWQRVDDEDVLQALAVGRPSNAKTHLVINWVERFFGPTYLKGGILMPILACAEEYATLLGCERVLIKDPVDPAIYERYGYTPYRLPKVAGSYLSKDIR